jgi:argininosuccinate lyase
MNKSNKLWGGRFEKDTASSMANLSKSTHFDWRLAIFDLLQTDVHVQALNKAKLINEAETKQIRNAIQDIFNKVSSGKLQPNITDEDVHTAIERLIIGSVGEIGGKIRAGRSRNDQAVTDFKLFLRGSARIISQELGELCSAINVQATKYFDQAAPGFTHLQHAQPVTLGHELAKHSQALIRDIERFTDWDVRVDSCPLGAGALAGNALVTDSMWVANQLGFSRPSENSIDAVSDRDFVAEYLFICSIIGVHLSKFAEEIILLSSTEFGYATLDDQYSTGSSIMPQKKNPDAAELTRGKSGRLIGNLTGLLVTLKGLPFAYNRDLQEDKEPVFDSHDTLMLLLPAFTGMIKTLSFNVEKLSSNAAKGHSLATEIADFLVKKKVPFNQAHEISGKCVKLAESKKLEVHELSANDLLSVSKELTSEVLEVLTVKSALNARSSYSGTSPNNVKAQIGRMNEKISVLNKWANHNPVPEIS